MFVRLSTRKKSEYVVEQVLNAIHRGELKAGDKLPPEDELARATGVSRPSVREALGALRLVGVLQTKVGDGTYISSTPYEGQGNGQVSSRLFSLLQEGENPFEALEARRALEATIVSYAVERRTPDDTQAIENALERINASIEDHDYDALLTADRDFHVAIGRATQNSVLSNSLCSLIDLMERSLWPRMKKELLQASPKHLDDTRRAHKQICAAIKAGDADSAKEALEMHFDDIESLFQ